MTIPVLVYHRVLPQKCSLGVTVDEFEGHLRWLKNKGYRALTGTEFEQALAGKTIGKRSVVIGFDDGYADNWYLAAPILKKYEMTAQLFIVTDKMLQRRVKPVGDWSDSSENCHLSWDEVDAMAASGLFEIHSHSHTHSRHWENGKSPSDTAAMVYRDIAMSVEMLRSRGYQHPIHLAWPWGYFQRDWLSAIAQLGIPVCHTMRPGTNFPGGNPLLVRRLDASRLSSASGRALFLAASSPRSGRLFNALSNAWGKLRGRP